MAVQMGNFASNGLAGTSSIGSNLVFQEPTNDVVECSDDEVSSTTTTMITCKEDGLECPVCCDSFNIVENVPYVLWCGHTLCKNCILECRWRNAKFPNLPLQLPLFISCPCCNLVSLRIIFMGNLKFPRKNFFLLWMVDKMSGNGQMHNSLSNEDRRPIWSSKLTLRVNDSIIQSSGPNHSRFDNTLTMNRLRSLLKASAGFVIQLPSKFPLVIIFLLIVLYVVPASATILALFLVITVLFALPALLVLYISYPGLEWLVREIIA